MITEENKKIRVQVSLGACSLLLSLIFDVQVGIKAPKIEGIRETTSQN